MVLAGPDSLCNLTTPDWIPDPSQNNTDEENDSVRRGAAGLGEQRPSRNTFLVSGAGINGLGRGLGGGTASGREKERGEGAGAKGLTLPR